MNGRSNGDPIISMCNLPAELYDTFFKAWQDSVPDAKYPVDTTVKINWEATGIYDYFYRLNDRNRWHTRNDIDFYKKHSCWRITRSEHLTNFAGKDEVSYNLEPLDTLDDGSYFLYFMPEQFLQMEVEGCP